MIDAFSPDEAQRLFRLDADLRREADQFLVESGLGCIIAEAGYQPVGSYVMQTMVWRDLDFERTADEPDWAAHWAMGELVSATGWPWKLGYVNAYRDPRAPGEKGYYWGVFASSPQGGPTWKLDLWTARPDEYTGVESRAVWAAAMTEEARLHILAIKEAVCNYPEYRKTLLSVHVYQAVLEHGIRDLDNFLAWWRARDAVNPED